MAASIDGLREFTIVGTENFAAGATVTMTRSERRRDLTVPARDEHFEGIFGVEV